MSPSDRSGGGGSSAFSWGHFGFALLCLPIVLFLRLYEALLAWQLYLSSVAERRRGGHHGNNGSSYRPRNGLSADEAIVSWLLLCPSSGGGATTGAGSRSGDQTEGTTETHQHRDPHQHQQQQQYHMSLRICLSRSTFPSLFLCGGLVTWWILVFILAMIEALAPHTALSPATREGLYIVHLVLCIAVPWILVLVATVATISHREQRDKETQRYRMSPTGLPPSAEAAVPVPITDEGGDRGGRTQHDTALARQSGGSSGSTITGTAVAVAVASGGGGGGAGTAMTTDDERSFCARVLLKALPLVGYVVQLLLCVVFVVPISCHGFFEMEPSASASPIGNSSVGVLESSASNGTSTVNSSGSSSSSSGTNAPGSDSTSIYSLASEKEALLWCAFAWMLLVYIAESVHQCTIECFGAGSGTPSKVCSMQAKVFATMMRGLWRFFLQYPVTLLILLAAFKLPAQPPAHDVSAGLNTTAVSDDFPTPNRVHYLLPECLWIDRSFLTSSGSGSGASVMSPLLARGAEAAYLSSAAGATATTESGIQHLLSCFALAFVFVLGQAERQRLPPRNKICEAVGDTTSDEEAAAPSPLRQTLSALRAYCEGPAGGRGECTGSCPADSYALQEELRSSEARAFYHDPLAAASGQPLPISVQLFFAIGFMLKLFSFYPSSSSLASEELVVSMLLRHAVASLCIALLGIVVLWPINMSLYRRWVEKEKRENNGPRPLKRIKLCQRGLDLLAFVMWGILAATRVDLLRMVKSKSSSVTQAPPTTLSPTPTTSSQQQQGSGLSYQYYGERLTNEEVIVIVASVFVLAFIAACLWLSLRHGKRRAPATDGSPLHQVTSTHSASSGRGGGAVGHDSRPRDGSSGTVVRVPSGSPQPVRPDDWSEDLTESSTHDGRKGTRGAAGKSHSHHPSVVPPTASARREDSTRRKLVPSGGLIDPDQIDEYSQRYRGNSMTLSNDNTATDDPFYDYEYEYVDEEPSIVESSNYPKDREGAEEEESSSDSENSDNGSRGSTGKRRLDSRRPTRIPPSATAAFETEPSPTTMQQREADSGAGSPLDDGEGGRKREKRKLKRKKKGGAATVRSSTRSKSKGTKKKTGPAEPDLEALLSISHSPPAPGASTVGASMTGASTTGKRISVSPTKDTAKRRTPSAEKKQRLRTLLRAGYGEGATPAEISRSRSGTGGGKAQRGHSKSASAGSGNYPTPAVAADAGAWQYSLAQRQEQEKELRAKRLESMELLRSLLQYRNTTAIVNPDHGQPQTLQPQSRRWQRSDSGTDEPPVPAWGGEEEEKQTLYHQQGGYHPTKQGEIFGHRFMAIHKLGWGEFSVVWLARDMRAELEEDGGPEFVALKISKAAISFRRAALSELEVLRELRSRVNCCLMAASTWTPVALGRSRTSPNPPPGAALADSLGFDSAKDRSGSERPITPFSPLALPASTTGTGGPPPAVSSDPFAQPQDEHEDDEAEQQQHQQQHSDYLKQLSVASVITSFEHIGPNGSHIVVAMKLCGPNVLRLISTHEFQGVSLPIVKVLLRQVLTGLSVLSQVGLIHGDVKPENVLFAFPSESTMKWIAEYQRRNRTTHPSSAVSPTRTTRMAGTAGAPPYGSTATRINAAAGNPRGDSAVSTAKQWEAPAVAKPQRYTRDDIRQFRRVLKGKYTTDGYVNALEALLAQYPVEIADFGTARWTEEGIAHAVGTVGCPMSLRSAASNTSDVCDDVGAESSSPGSVQLPVGIGRTIVGRNEPIEIQTLEYRAPEVVLGYPERELTPAIDIWSAACMSFELITGSFLFDPKSYNGERLFMVSQGKGNAPVFDEKLCHLYLFQQFCGPLTNSVLRKSTNPGKCFNVVSTVEGEPVAYQFRGPDPGRRTKLATLLETHYLEAFKGDREEIRLFADFLMKILELDPAKRPTPETMLRHPWLAF